MVLRSTLIVAEVALALVLVTGGALMMQSLLRLTQQDIGFDRRNLITINTGLPFSMDVEDRMVMERRIEETLSQLPGVAAVGFADFRPLGSGLMPLRLEASSGEAVVTGLHGVSPGYFDTLGLQLIQGRSFTSDDRVGAPEVAVVSESTAQTLWPGEEAVGKTLAMRGSTFFGGGQVERNVVGVVSDALGVQLRGGKELAVYAPHAQAMSTTGLDILIRIREGVAPTPLILTIREELAAIDPMLAVSNAGTMEQSIASQAEQSQFLALVVSVFAGLSLMMTVVIVAGVVSYLVRARTYEFGVRMALGARPGQVIAMMLRYGGWLGLIGVAVGALGSLALGRVLDNVLFEVRPTDPVTLVASSILLFFCVLIACYIPARRAMRIDPAQALRNE